MIRLARPADHPALASLQSHLREPSPGLLEGALDGAAFAPATVLVSAVDDGDSGGDRQSAARRPRGDRPVGYLLAVPGDGTTYVAELVVAPGYRREGRARALLDACAGRSGDDAALTVTVAPDNGAAGSLYRSCGFERVERLPEFFDDGDAVLYRRD